MEVSSANKKTRKKRPKLCHNNKVYTFSYTSGENDYYRCSDRACYGRLKQKNGIITTSQVHTCNVGCFE